MSLSPRGPILLLVNPRSGRGRALAGAEEARRILVAAGAAVDLVATGSAAEVGERSATAAAAGTALVVVAGGDGTVQIAAAALAGSATVLGLLPSGRGNDLARALAIPREAGAAARLLLAGEPRRVDLGSCGGRRFVTVASLGLDAEASALMHRGEVRGHGTVAYLTAALLALARFRPSPAVIDGDFGRIEVRALLVATANTRSYGGGMRIAPDARPDDGLFDVCIVPEIGRLRVLGLLPRVFWGGHARHKAVTLVRTRRLTIATERPLPLYADGEPLALTPAILEVAPGALQVMAPAATPPHGTQVGRMR